MGLGHRESLGGLGHLIPDFLHELNLFSRGKPANLGREVGVHDAHIEENRRHWQWGVEAPNAAEQLCYEEKIELLAAAFLKLPARCRTIMTLRKLKGQSVREIAAALDITEGTVDHQITRGTHLLRAYLEEAGVRSFNRD